MGKTWKLPPLPPPPPKFTPPTLDFQSGSIDAEVVQVYGTKALWENILKLNPIAVDAAGYEMANIAREVIKDSQENYVPFVTGKLHDSADHDEYEPGRRQGIEIAMWYAGVVTDEQWEHGVSRDPQKYALEVHENMLNNHPHGGGPKYLEWPFQKIQGTITGRLAQAVGDAFRAASNGPTRSEE